ncbi:hypothetical protein IEQ34_019944 [Dendrobium chrysotoxum]|uniref:Uncharacterized protein n=1 Tax=Dendrobium chrysotoxum TaxID=161865 RepID=A0AAV7GA25_DENCH|nr:hypothetical protein IEQ34_019944 [Dendrobium chrysotoxum]
MFIDTLMLWPADLISNGKISDGTSHPSGPQDHAKADTYTQMKATNKPPCGNQVHQASDNRRYEGSLVAEAYGFEEHRGIEHDSVYAGDLLKKRDKYGHGELWSIPTLYDLFPWMLHRLGVVTGDYKIMEFLMYLISATHLAEHRLGRLLMPAFN